MDSQTAQGVLMAALVCSGVAVLVFETAKAEITANRVVCVCGHKRNGRGLDSHVRAMDYDNAAYIAGAEYKTGQCRSCKCRSFHGR